MNDDIFEPSETWKTALRTKINGALEFPVSKDVDGASESQPQPLYETEWHTLFGGIGAQAVADYLRAKKKIAQLKEDTFEMEVERERQRRRSLQKSPFHRYGDQQQPGPSRSPRPGKEDESLCQKGSITPEHADFDPRRRQAALEIVEKELCCQDVNSVSQIREVLGLRLLELEERESDIERAEAQVNWRIYALRKKELELQKKDALMKAAWVESQQHLHEREQQWDKDRRKLLKALAVLQERENEMDQLQSELSSMRSKIATMEGRWFREKEIKCRGTGSLQEHSNRQCQSCNSYK